MQDSLFALPSPLDLKLGRDFFISIPKSPGVYKMFGDDGSILYVGKAKNLKTRLMSYRRIKINASSKKSIRLVHHIAHIEWEICETEERALVKENELLRNLKPPFNVVNTRPETYFYFSVVQNLEPVEDSSGALVSISLLMNPETDPQAAVFGAFKGLASCHRAFLALRRLIWLVHDWNPEDPLNYPLELVRRQRLVPHTCRLERVWLNRLAGFFHGFSLSPTQKEPELVGALKAFIGKITCDPFHQNWLQEDLESLLRFYRSGPARNAKIKVYSPTDSPTIEKNEVDDLLVKQRFHS